MALDTSLKLSIFGTYQGKVELFKEKSSYYTSPTRRCRSYWKENLWVASVDYIRPTLLWRFNGLVKFLCLTAYHPL